MGCPIGLSGNAHLNALTINVTTEAKRFPVVNNNSSLGVKLQINYDM